MKLSRVKRRDIVSEVINSLFTQPQTALKDKRNTLAREIWEYEIQPYQTILASLPEKFYTKEDYCFLKFKDPRPETTAGSILKWHSEFSQPVLVSIHNSNWGSKANVSTTTVDVFADRIIEILTAQDKLEKERKTLKTYLTETINSVNTTKQLKAVWDEVFHKFIPIDPPKPLQANKAIVEAALSVDTPDIDKVKDRMVDNLLKAD